MHVHVHARAWGRAGSPVLFHDESGRARPDFMGHMLAQKAYPDFTKPLSVGRRANARMKHTFALSFFLLVLIFVCTRIFFFPLRCLAALLAPSLPP